MNNINFNTQPIDYYKQNSGLGANSLLSSASAISSVGSVQGVTRVNQISNSFKNENNLNNHNKNDFSLGNKPNGGSNSFFVSISDTAKATLKAENDIRATNLANNKKLNSRLDLNTSSKMDSIRQERTNQEHANMDEYRLENKKLTNLNTQNVNNKISNQQALTKLTIAKEVDDKKSASIKKNEDLAVKKSEIKKDNTVQQNQQAQQTKIDTQLANIEKIKRAITEKIEKNDDFAKASSLNNQATQKPQTTSQDSSGSASSNLNSIESTNNSTSQISSAQEINKVNNNDLESAIKRANQLNDALKVAIKNGVPAAVAQKAVKEYSIIDNI